jgi:hypothetical protein
MLYALTDEEVRQLRAVPEEERYDFMLEQFEDELFGTPRACELDKAWIGLQYSLGGGRWREENRVPLNIIFSGEFLVETEDAEIITLKTHSDVDRICTWLQTHDLEAVIRENFPKITDPDFPYKGADGLEHTLGWSEDLRTFYENAKQEHLSVIFTVDA